MRAMLAALTVAVLILPPGGPGAPSAAAAGSAKPLKVRSTFPAADATGVLTDPVVVQFSGPVDGTTLNAATLHLRGSAWGVPGTATVEGDRKGRRMVFRPATPLQPGGGYEFIMTTGIRGVTGAELQEEFRMAFSVSPAKPVGQPAPLPAGVRLRRVPRLGPPPRVVWTAPAVGLGSVFTDEVTVRFNRPVSPATVNAQTFQLLQGTVAQEGRIEEVPSTGGREFRIVPVAPLFRDTSYAMVVTRSVRSDRGRPLKEEFRGAFSTSPLKNGVKPLEPTDFQQGPLLLRGRAFHTAHRLDDGRIAVLGGQDLDGTPTATLELLPSLSGAFAPGPSMESARTFHASVVLKDGRLLAIGGYSETRATLPACEAFDPKTGAWVAVGALRTGRASHTATLLAGGRVFVAGGFTRVGGVLQYAPETEIFDPFLNQWSAGPMLRTPRGAHTATVLKDGRILLAGGAQFGERSAEVYDPVTGALTRTFGAPGEDRTFHAAALTKSGGVLLAGGGPPNSEQYVPLADGFSPSGPMPVIGLPVTDSPVFPTLTPITEGRVVLLGGLSVGGAPGGADLILSQVLLWDAGGSGGTGAFYRMPFDLAVPRAGHTVTANPDGSFLVIGGLGNGAYNERSTTFLRP